ncbi:MAG: hypothetical protein JWQ81_4552 [Amycolatopsis sp.]|uniref:hypothetical protein n=1 Tax=Amycolatopsis sp. TaxID=37632 RepID=UPI002605FB63|nr:hypothetical protein [Amycolatopsis sp.]MCU1683813.1 hypothetical protein [Amycolatopsis sp.]
MQLFRTTLGAARREGDELVVLDGTADVVEWAMSDDASSAVDPNTARITAILPAVLDVCTDDRHTVVRYLVTTFGSTPR